MKNNFEMKIGKVTILFIAVLCLVFLFQQFFDLSGFYFSRDFLSKPWIIITAMLMHANVVHLLYNLYSLFIFGSVLEANTSSRNVLAVILLGGIMGNIGFAIFSEGFALGFSGSVYALIGAVTFLLPDIKIPLPFGIIMIPAKAKFAGPLMAFGELVLSIASFDGIAHSAHAFGFIGGVFLVWMIKKRVKNKVF